MRVVDQIDGRIEPPAPREVPDQFVLECLDAEAEGDGMLFAALWENRLLYAKAAATWYVWNGHAWQRDRVGLAQGLVRQVVERYGRMIAHVEKQLDGAADDDQKKRFRRKIERLQAKIRALRQTRGRNACLDFAVSFFGTPLTIEGKEFDRNPWLLGVRNGVVDLRTGELMDGSPEQMVSRQCSCDYDPEIDMGDWLRFLDAVYNGDRELMDFVQRLFGYGITGSTCEHIFPFFLGRGRNGKSKLLKTIARVAGGYAASVPCEIFLKGVGPRNADAPNPAIMKHEGLRLAFSSEVEEGSRFSAQAVKRMTGGDNLDGRDMYGAEWREFEPTHLSVMIGNHEPVPPAGDPAFWDRTILIYHPVRFVKGEPDPNKLERPLDPDMDAKLQAMDPQVLAWLIEGAVKWYQGGRKLRPPESVRKITEDYREDADWITRWLDDCCVRSPGQESGSSTLYESFTLWYRENINSKAAATPSQRAWGQKLKALGEFRSVRRGGGYVYQGLGLNETWARRVAGEEEQGGMFP